MKYTCHSGGCPGSDMTWENEGLPYGVHTIAYSFWNHRQEGRNQKILSGLELKEGFEHVLKANEVIKKYPQGQSQYVKNLLARNWFQVKNSESVIAIAKSIKGNVVEGGTGWAVQMAIDNRTPVYVYDQTTKHWYYYLYKSYEYDKYGNSFVLMWNFIPSLTKNFAGIGTREINQDGITAIKTIYKNTFGHVYHPNNEGKKTAIDGPFF
jgi:hypothetical protein